MTEEQKTDRIAWLEMDNKSLEKHLESFVKMGPTFTDNAYHASRKRYWKKASKILTLLLILSLCGNGIQYGWINQINKNHDEYTTTLRHNFEQRELGYRVRLDALSREAVDMGLRADSLVAGHRDRVRQDSLRIVELSKIKGKFDKLTADQVRSKMIEEYEQSKK